MDTRLKNNPSPIAARSSLKSERFSPGFVPGSRCWDSVLWWPIFGISADGPHIAQHGVAPHEASLWFGTLIIAVGVAVHLISAWRYVRLAGELRHASVLRRHLSEQGVVVALILALLGIALAIYMILVHGEPAGGAMRA